MDIPLKVASTDGRRQGQALDIDTKPRRPANMNDIPGWGSDLDRSSRPAEPKERRPARLEGLHWHEPSLQEPHVSVLHSSERSGLTPIFGSPQPPRGPSGAMRRFAFGYSENDLRHWLMLLAADRVDVFEGLVSDLAQGHLPRLYAETGGRAELKYNPGRAVLKLGIVMGLAAAFTVWRRHSRGAFVDGRR